MKNMSNTHIEIIDEFNKGNYLPSIEEAKLWLNRAIVYRFNNIDIKIYTFDYDKSELYNINYRKKLGATNILSFSYERTNNLIGELIICAPLVRVEAKQMNKTEKDHWIHLFVHGMLHLQGYDHEKEQEALIMEKLEYKILGYITNNSNGD